MFASAKEVAVELSLTFAISEPHASNELVDLLEDLPHSREEQGDIDAKPAPMPLKRHENLLKVRTARRQRWEQPPPP